MMLRSLVAAALVAGTGCVTWQTTHASDASSFKDNRAFLVTAGRAFDLDVSRIDAAGVHGTARHVWTVPAGKLNLDYLNDTTDSPEQIAANLGWPADHADDGKPISVDRATIEYVRERRVSGGRTVLAVVGGLALAALVGIVIVGVAVASVSCGRPLRVRGRRCITPAISGTDWTEPVELAAVPADALPVLIEVWTEEARAEHAAIAAFSKLSLELLALGAPPQLVSRANQAALQEIEHARMCFALASAYSGHPIGPAALPQALEGDTADLIRLGRESVLDGCIREGVAAVIARLGAEGARDPAIARVLRIQANEETQHADLGWAIVDWCLERGGEPMRGELISAIAEAQMPRCDDLPAHGRVGRAAVRPYFDELCARARERLSRVVLAAAA